MRRRVTWGRTALVVAAAGAFALSLSSCGQSGSSPSHADESKAQRAVKECRAQWSDLGDNVVGMDQDDNPSALSDRWTSVIATVDYYEQSKTASNCQSNVDAQRKAVTALEQFTEKLRPYDMTYQLGQVRAAIELYLNDPLPAPSRNENHKMVRPPSKQAVTAAMKTLADNAGEANVELQPGWQETTSVDLTDAAAVTKTRQDLDFLAQDSPHWRRCEEALQVLVAAIRAQEGLSGPATPSTSPSPTDATSPAG
jgi:hypothetical protein